MKRIILSMMLLMGAMTMVAGEAAAKRLGSGSSIGRQSSSVSKAPTATAKPATPAAATPAAVPPKPASPWKGILGGALLGLGLGALFSHLGIGGGLASMLSSMLMIGLLVLAAVFIYRMFKGKSASGSDGARPAYAGGSTPEIGSRVEPFSQPTAFQGASNASAGEQAAAPWGVPADFDVPAFLRNSKTYFIRLQAAWDKADINDIREFTTPEMYAELKLQIQERGASANTTDVVSIDAELMGVETVSDEYLASVRFTGMIKESAIAPAEPFTEVWNLVKPVSGSGGWILAGIQQLP
ncbi:TIM44-like domain-containing protein [soil metagenome]